MLVGARGPPLCRAVVSLTVKTMRAKRGLLENGGASLACEARLPRASSLPTRPGVPVSACLAEMIGVLRNDHPTVHPTNCTDQRVLSGPGGHSARQKRRSGNSTYHADTSGATLNGIALRRARIRGRANLGRASAPNQSRTDHELHSPGRPTESTTYLSAQTAFDGCAGRLEALCCIRGAGVAVGQRHHEPCPAVDARFDSDTAAVTFDDRADHR
jgi:hypothetical protein